jgi:hypothetical protein
MTFVYIRGNCQECEQNNIYGWVHSTIFICCACHDQYDETDTRPVMTVQITGDYITECPPPSPVSVFVSHT